MLESIDTTTGERKSDNRVKMLDAMEAEVELDRKVSFESYDKTHELGRFILYNNNKFAGIGTIL